MGRIMATTQGAVTGNEKTGDGNAFDVAQAFD